MTDVTVTQEDRDAAWAMWTIKGDTDKHRWDQGRYDSIELVQAFARHRQSSTEEVERLRVMLERMSEAMERDGDPAYAHLIMDARAALTGATPHDD